MVTHSVRDPVSLATRGLCNVSLKCFFLWAADYAIGILPANLSFSLTARKTYERAMIPPQGDQRSQTRSDFMKLAFSVWPTRISHLDNF